MAKMTAKQALEAGFTHHGLYYGIPVYIGDLEFKDNHPVVVATKHPLMGYVFNFVAIIEWLFTPPGGKSLFLIGPEIKESDE